MSNATNPHDLYSVWQQSLEQSMNSWKTLIGQSQKKDLLRFWSQNLEALTRMLQPEDNMTDALARWKRFTDEVVEASSKALEEAMETEAFAAAVGKSLDQYLNTMGPLRKSLQSGSEEYLRTMNVPSRQQVTSLAAQVVAVDARLEAMQELIEALVEEVTALRGAQQAEGDDIAGGRTRSQGEKRTKKNKEARS